MATNIPSMTKTDRNLWSTIIAEASRSHGSAGPPGGHAIYVDAAKKVAAAGAEQDLVAATGAVRKLARTCSGCHKPHK